MGYSRLVAWEVYNFMAYTHAKCEFDEKGVVTIKGYNDSGKSAMLQALNVLMFNIKANQQVGFIKDDCDYFRVLAYFDDGVTILRDKYINGQSLYEMYKGDELLFSTKSGKALTKVSGVPDPIADYLGLLHHDGTCLNSRSCIEKQLLVQTTGSENYKLLNVILKSEELAVASQMLNDDKNRIVQDINITDSKLQSAKELAGGGSMLNAGLLGVLEEADRRADELGSLAEKVSSMAVLASEAAGIGVPPEVAAVGMERLGMAGGMVGVLAEMRGIGVPPELVPLDCARAGLLEGASSLLGELAGVSVPPEVMPVDGGKVISLLEAASALSALGSLPDILQLCLVDGQRVGDIMSLAAIAGEHGVVVSEMAEAEARLGYLDAEAGRLTAMLQEFGYKAIKCPNCGAIYDDGGAHAH